MTREYLCPTTRPSPSTSSGSDVALRSLGRCAAAEDQGDDCEHQEHEEQELRNTHRAGGNTAEPEDGGDQCDDEKYGGPIQHLLSPSFRGPCRDEPRKSRRR